MDFAQDDGSGMALGGVAVRAIVAALHLLALGLGMASVVVRGLRLRDLRRAPQDDRALVSLFRADGLWGLAALLWIATGLLRAFGGLEKAAAFYTRNGFFHLKMTLFVVILLLEIRPMVTFIRWRIQRARAAAAGQAAAFEPPLALIRLNDLEIAVLVLIPFTAALMARGAWLF
jgi:putative membrane protein